ncbi:formimidoylglutamate deiminase [Pseudonocardia nigra]|uniref:formimidoylglutamate deiminase n=1 Tax=Pseudonocardia nigra TaxID=1921578 RepID=UPI001C5EC6B3|nr:formimidoylglutamate deiminase [Pseudonocardia nigra]
MTDFWAGWALLPDGPAADVLFVVDGGRFREVRPGSRPGGARRLPGVVLPGFANVHSHAFHRALRGRTHDDGGTFWTWRERMYAVAARLDPASYLALARAAYAEMALAGVTAVGEFHYLHHDPAGRPYADPNAMAHALCAAAADAGIRLTLLDTCYLAGGLDAGGHRPLDDVQRRFSDGGAGAWAARVGELRETSGMRVGVAVHSVRAVPRAALGTVAAVAAGRPLHVHLSEQPAENEACLAHHGLTPTALLAAEGVLSTATTAVHATHLTGADVAALGGAGTGVCLCPTTERDLADGIGPAQALRAAGVPLSLGSDQHAVVDPFEEARAVEMHERLRTGERDAFTPGELLAALTRHDALGWPDAGWLAAGARADLVAVRTDTVRTAGCDPAQILFAATAADVDTVIVDGDVVVAGGEHRLGAVGRLLTDAIAPLWRDR